MDVFFNLFGLEAAVTRQIILLICSLPGPGAVPHGFINLFGLVPEMILLICSVGRPDDFINLFGSGCPNGDIIK